MDGPLGISACPSPSLGNVPLLSQQPFSPISCLTFGETHFLAHFSRLSRPRPRPLDSLSTPRPESSGNCPKEVTFVRRISGDPSRYFSLRPSLPRVATCFFILHRSLSRRHLVTFFTTPIDVPHGLNGEREKEEGPLRSLTLSSARI